VSLAVEGARSPHWRTPLTVYAELHREFKFTLDPCPNDPAFDGLAASWAGHRVFLNPPYGRGRIQPWLEKAISEAKAGALVVALLPSYTGSPWWHDLVIPNASEIRFLRGKLRFNDTKGVAPFWSAVVVFGGAPAESCSAPMRPRLSTEPDTMRPEVLDAQQDAMGGGEPGERT
jgi:site-specific DNA-methyltransferase (adenine-specific)